MKAATRFLFWCSSGSLRAGVVILCVTVFTVSSFSDGDSVAVIIADAKRQCELTKEYDPAYYKIDYPGGDIPITKGVCTDVIIRSFRATGLDLQKLIHEDMKRAFKKYPQKWGLRGTDRNIDHRRVPNIQTWLERNGKSIPVSDNAADYLPGDIVTWKLPNDLDHIGLVADIRVEYTERYAVIHNIGNGTEVEDILFFYDITGHYRYFRAGYQQDSVSLPGELGNRLK
jgi:uncharacterized protein YijF (DUF1287 family)